MGYQVPRHIWRTADDRLVPDGDVDAAFLAYPAGTELTDHDAKAKGLLDVYPPADEEPGDPDGKSEDKAGDKSVGKPDDKSVGKPEDKSSADPLEEPKKSASKADWVEYAVSKGGDRADAESATRDDLAVIWGSSGKK